MIKTLYPLLVSSLLFTPLLAQTPAQLQVEILETDRLEIPGQLVVCFETAEAALDLQDAVGAWGLESVDESLSIDAVRSLVQWQRRGETAYTHIVLVEYTPAGFDNVTLRQQVMGKAGVEWASPNVGITSPVREYDPNDPQYPNQYHHPLMRNNLAWDITLGDPSIVLGITDDGVDLDHEDLVSNIWVNSGEVRGNGVDDDGNGFVDDVNGFDFVFDNNDPNPNGGDDHGTHVAGIAAGDTDNGVGIAGTAGNCAIQALQFYASGQPWTAVNIMEAFAYGADNGAHIISTSYNINGWVNDPIVTAAFDYIYDQGVMHFNSAGNGSELNPVRQAFHQTFLVVSTDSNDQKSSFSNYGTGVDVCAPGDGILSTVLNDGYGTKSGTSMAAPNAAGVAALIWSANPTWTRDQVAAQLYATADDIEAQNPGFEGLLGGGRVNAFSALTMTLPAPRLTKVAGLPEEGDSLTGDLADFQLRFDQVLDPATVHAMGAFQLTYAGPDDTFGTSDDVAIGLDQEEYLISSNRVALSPSSALPGAGRYRVTADGALVANPFGTLLDGDGDGVGGDSWTRTFHACGTIVLFEDFAESGADWSVVDDAGLQTGTWTVPPEVPVGGGIRNDPPTDYDGSGKCFLTENAAGNSDVDGSWTRLISRALDTTVTADPYISYARWHVTSGGDPLRVQISGNDGASWKLMETFNGGEGWEIATFRVADFVAPSAQTRLRFSVGDLGGASITESAIDYLRILEIDCGTPNPIGTNYCVGAPNSAGAGATIAGYGSDVVADNDCTLVATGAPASQFGLFFFGPSQVQVPLGDGFLCVGGTLVRLSVVSTDSLGIAELEVDLTKPPASTHIQSGADLNFQFWFRDSPTFGAGNNLSDGLNVVWQ